MTGHDYNTLMAINQHFHQPYTPLAHMRMELFGAAQNGSWIMERHQAIADGQRARFNAEVAKFTARRAVLDIDC